jgi:hypothetical protein
LNQANNSQHTPTNFKPMPTSLVPVLVPVADNQTGGPAKKRVWQAFWKNTYDRFLNAMQSKIGPLCRNQTNEKTDQN